MSTAPPSPPAPETASGSKPDLTPSDDPKSFWNDARKHQVQILGYIAAATATVYGIWKLLGQKDETFGPANWQFWVALTVTVLPVLVTLFTNVIPSWWERRRVRRLRDWSVEGNSGQPGYFRLTPYGGTEADQDAFKREDQAHTKMLSWLRETPGPLLYLTGVSGSGKSSVLAAHVIPNLGGDTLVVSLRASDDPIGRLREALLAPSAVWTAETADNHQTDGDEELLRNAATWLNKRKFGLLLVFDQFEEFLVLHTSGTTASTAPLLALLQSVATGRCGPARALASLRIEFIDELTRAGLPPFTDRNHFTVPAFTDGAAKRFLSAGFDRLGQDLLDRVVAETAALDNLVGYVRPITLNMAGQMLRRMPGDAARISVGARPFANYVRRIFEEGDVRDHAPGILRQLVDDQNRRVHKSARELAGLSGDVHLINGCLTRLALPERGLTRCLNPAEVDIGSRRWEVSHDFVASDLTGVLPTFRPSVWKRARPWLAPAALVLWVGTFVWFLPYESQRATQRRRDATIVRLSTEFGVRITKVEDDGSLAIRLDPKHRLSSLTEVVPLLNTIGAVTSLDAKNHESLENLDRCAELRGLRVLDLSECSKLTNVDGLKGLTTLQTLDLRSCGKLTNVGGLKGLTELRTLRLGYCDKLRNVDDLKELTTLQNLDLSGCNKLTNVDGLKGLTELRTLNLSWCIELTNMDGLKGLTALQNLDLRGCDKLDGLKGLTALRTLNLGWCDKRTNVDDLKELTTLQNLDLSGCNKLTNVDGLKGLTELRTLNLSWCIELTNVDGLKRLTALQNLDLSNWPLRKMELIDRLRADLKNTTITY